MGIKEAISQYRYRITDVTHEFICNICYTDRLKRGLEGKFNEKENAMQQDCLEIIHAYRHPHVNSMCFDAY